MDREMNADAELLETLLNEAPMTDRGPLSAKLLRFWTGYAIQTISDYKLGRLTIPVRFWRLVLRHFRDPRIFELLFGDLSYDVIIYDDVPDLTTSRDMFTKAIDALGVHHEGQKYLAEICRDGRIDEADGAALKSYNRSHLEYRRLSAGIHKAVNGAYARNCERRHVS